METIQEVENRTKTGRKVKSLRRAGITPANVFGPGIESRSIQASTADLEKTMAQAGATHLITLKNPSDGDRSVLIKGAQRDPLTGDLLHVDFYQVRLEDKVKVTVPIVFEGDSPAAKRKDLVLLENLSSVDVECLPTDIPDKIVIDLSHLEEAGDHIIVSEIVVGDEVNILTHPDEMVARVTHAKTAEEIEEIEEGVIPEEEAEEAEAEESEEESASE